MVVIDNKNEFWKRKLQRLWEVSFIVFNTIQANMPGT